MRVRALAAVPAAVAALALAPAGIVSAAARKGDIGHEDQGYSPLGRSATGSKPESKLWFNGGWWATMFSPAARAHHIHRFDPATQTWVDTGVATDERDNTRADALWDAAAGKLYVASHLSSMSGTSAAARKAGRLYRYSYDAAARRYALDPGFPVMVNAAKSETLVIDKDTTGTLWATWTQGSRVYVNHSVGGNDAAWGTPYVVPGPGTTLNTPWPELYYRNLVRFFVDEILEGRPQECTFYDGAKSQEIVNAISLSHKERRWVDLPLYKAV